MKTFVSLGSFKVKLEGIYFLGSLVKFLDQLGLVLLKLGFLGLHLLDLLPVLPLLNRQLFSFEIDQTKQQRKLTPRLFFPKGRWVTDLQRTILEGSPSAQPVQHPSASANYCQETTINFGCLLMSPSPFSRSPLKLRLCGPQSLRQLLLLPSQFLVPLVSVKMRSRVRGVLELLDLGLLSPDLLPQQPILLRQVDDLLLPLRELFQDLLEISAQEPSMWCRRKGGNDSSVPRHPQHIHNTSKKLKKK